MTTPPTPVKSERAGTHPALIVAATVLTVFVLTFVIYSVGGADGQESAGGGGSNYSKRTAEGAVALPSRGSVAAATETATARPPARLTQ